jgi:hypothetical protein
LAASTAISSLQDLTNGFILELGGHAAQVETRPRELR